MHPRKLPFLGRSIWRGIKVGYTIDLYLSGSVVIFSKVGGGGGGRRGGAGRSEILIYYLTAEQCTVGVST
jgi:hypothetical protein